MRSLSERTSGEIINSRVSVNNDDSFLVNVSCIGDDIDVIEISSLLKRDSVVLIKNVHQSDIDPILAKIASQFGLMESLELQASFANSMGHREKISDYFMSVNMRKDFHYVPPHSEGSSFACLQLASFYCFENTTDGGETVLMNVDQSSDVWESLKEFVIRAKPVCSPSKSEVAKARAMYRLDLLKDTLENDDIILNEAKVEDNLTLFEVLAAVKKSYSLILDKEINVFWDSICAVDTDILDYTKDLLIKNNLYKKPSENDDAERIDWDPRRRVLRSGVDYNRLFKHMITCKLNPGDLIIYNNFTWTHSVNNWTPGRGVRKVAAAFA